MPPRRTGIRAGFAGVVFALLLSVGLGYAAASTDREEVPLFDAGTRAADAFGNGVAWVVPKSVADALFVLLPGWFGYPEFGAVLGLAATLVLWAAAEAHWAGWTLETAVDWAGALREADSDADEAAEMPSETAGDSPESPPKTADGEGSSARAEKRDRE